MSIEYWFDGTLENGTITSSSQGLVASEENKDIEYFMETIYAFQEGLNEEGIEYTIALFPSNLIYLETSEFYGDLSLIDEGTGSLEQEIADGIVFTLTFMDYEILNVNGVTVVFSDTIKMSKLWQRDIYNISIKNEKLRDLFMSFKENKIFYATDLCGTDFKQVIDFSIRR